MYFNSYIFLFVFLPLVILGYYFINSTGRYRLGLLFLLGMSWWFYAFIHPAHLVLLVVSTVINYMIYLLYERYPDNGKKERRLFRRGLLIAAIAGNLGALLFLKYYNFFSENIHWILQRNFTERNIWLPLGISFITFQQIAFVADAYRGEIPHYSLLEYALFVAFFPHVSSGPIILHDQFLPMLEETGRKRINWDSFASGIYIFVMGLGKKVLLADWFGKAVDWGYSNISVLNSCSAFFVSIAFSIQIYFDFSGYSDMAIGISRMLGLDLPVNFNSPYKADTIMEFWNRWHITLTKFLTKYLYIPLGGNRKGKIRTALNTMVVFLCSGFWHGANWTFVLWGFLHGGFVVVCKELDHILKRIPKTIKQVITLSFVNLTWIPFRAGSFSEAREMLNAILKGGGGGLKEELCSVFQFSLLQEVSGWNAGIPYWFNAVAVTVVIGLALVLHRNVEEKSQVLKHSIWEGGLVVLVFILSVMSFSGISSFIYFKF